MKSLTIKIFKLVSPVFWLILLLSISSHLVYWRIVYEPGIVSTDYENLKIFAQLLLFLGSLGTVFINYKIYTDEKAGLKRIWIWNGVATILYIPVALATLLLLA